MTTKLTEATSINYVYTDGELKSFYDKKFKSLEELFSIAMNLTEVELSQNENNLIRELERTSLVSYFNDEELTYEVISSIEKSIERKACAERKVWLPFEKSFEFMNNLFLVKNGLSVEYN